MALKATIYKARLQLADMDRGVYGDYNTTIARHPSETDERLLIRLLAFALNVPTTTDDDPLEFAKDLWDTDEPALWQRDISGLILHWIEVGQPDEKRLLRASRRAARVSVYSFAAPVTWWPGIANRITRARNLSVWQVPADQSQALALLAQRSMDLQVTVQDGAIWVGDGNRSVQVAPHLLYGPTDAAPSTR